MSAIVGRFNLDGQPVSRDALGRMLDVQKHRGPERQAVWADGAVGLGHGALFIADHSLYPIQSADGLLTLVANARIDNRDELARVLGVPLPEKEDGPLILAAYQRWGLDCAEKLLGDFVFVIWDAREHRLFAARDPFGVRSIFYHFASHRHFVFGSEIKALWCHSDVEKQIDEIRLAEALQVIDTDAARTMFKDVRAVPAGHTLLASANGLKISRYWHLELAEELRLSGMDAYAEALRERFLLSVRRRLRDAEKVAIELSGGLDSSSIACAAAQERTGTELHTLSLRYPNHPLTDEGTYIDAVLQSGSFNPHMIDGTSRSTLDDIDSILEYIDDPSMVIGNHHLGWILFDLAQKIGVKVHMTGFDGDTVIGHGLDRYYEMVHAHEWDILMREASLMDRNIQQESSGASDQLRLLTQKNILNGYIRGYMDRASAGGHWRAFAGTAQSVQKQFGTPARVWWKRYGRRIVIPPSVQRYRKQRRIRLTPFIDKDLARRTHLRERVVESDQQPPWPATVRDVQVHTLNQQMFRRIIEGLDLYGSAFGIESSHPFLDRELVEFCVSLPSAVRLTGGLSRAILREAMKGILPEKVRMRPGKADLEQATVDASGKDAQRLKALLESPGRLEEFIDMRALGQALNDQPQEGGLDSIRLSVLLPMQTWLNKNFES